MGSNLVQYSPVETAEARISFFCAKGSNKQPETTLSKENQKLFGKTCNSIINIIKIECINGLSAFKRLALAKRRISMLEPLDDKQKLKFLACSFF